MKYGLILFFLLIVFLFAGCAAYNQDPEPPAAEQTSTASTLTVEQNGTTHTLSGVNAKALLTLLESLDYDPQNLCKCLPSTTVTCTDGTTYGIDLGETPYVRLFTAPQAQANLTEEQAKTLQQLLSF